MNQYAQISIALDRAVRAVCPIDGVAIKTITDKTKWRIDFAPEATAEQRASAQSTLDAFDVTAASAPPSDVEKELACKDYLNGATSIAWHLSIRKVLIAKAVSDEAYRLGKAPGALTVPELQALRQRIANIYKAL